MDRIHQSFSGADMAESIKVRKIGKYILKEKLGEGSMGSVWLSYHTGLNIPVAIKLLNMDLAEDDPDFLNRFMQEGRLAGQLNHKNIVRIYDAGMEGSSAFIVMEFIEGCDTLELLEERGIISPDEVLGLAIAIAEALQEAHSLGIIHRDIKPDNILATTEGRIKLADLGLAKHIDDNMGSTMAGTALGTPYYIAPEQALDAIKADARSDIYSFGATLYHLLSGHLPYDGDNIMGVMLRHTNEELVPPQVKRPGLPESFCRVICKMMEKDPDKRYQNCAELLEDFNKLKYGIDDVAMSEDDLFNQSEKALSRNLASGKSVRVKMKPNLVGKYAHKNSSKQTKKKSGSGSRSKQTRKRNKSSSNKTALIVGIIAFFILSLAILPSIIKQDGLPGDKGKEIVNDISGSNEGSGSTTGVQVEKVEALLDNKKIDLLASGGSKYFEAASKYFTFKDAGLTIDDLGERHPDEIKTKDIYDNFTLTAEYRFLKENSDGGIHFHINGEQFFEVQSSLTQTPKSGVLLARGGLKFIINNQKKSQNWFHGKAEKPQGEWNVLVISVKGDELTVFLNDKRLYDVYGLSRTSGYISITRWYQCHMEYRKLQLEKLD